MMEANTREKPIIFSGPMVRAILEGRKTQTRRVMKPQPVYDPELSQKVHTFGNDKGGWYWEAKNKGTWYNWDGWPGFDCRIYLDGPYQPGDSLWVRETWAVIKSFDNLAPSEIPKGSARWPTVWYAEPERAAASIKNTGAPIGKIRPSIFMPRWASRITLEVVNVRVECLQDISEDDAKAEGIVNRVENRTEPGGVFTYSRYGLPEWDWNQCSDYSFKDGYKRLWDSINAARPGCAWQDNPWVWVVEFSGGGTTARGRV